MKKFLNITIPYGVKHQKFVNYEIHEGFETISYGRLYHDGTAYVSCWNGTYFMVENVDSSILLDFIEGKKSLSEIAFYLKSAYLEMQDIIEEETDEALRYDLRNDYLIHNFSAYTMEEVDNKKKENQKKLKKFILSAI